MISDLPERPQRRHLADALDELPTVFSDTPALNAAAKAVGDAIVRLALEVEIYDNQQALTRSTNEVSRRQERLLELRRQRGDDV